MVALRSLVVGQHQCQFLVELSIEAQGFCQSTAVPHQSASSPCKGKRSEMPVACLTGLSRSRNSAVLAGQADGSPDVISGSLEVNEEQSN